MKTRVLLPYLLLVNLWQLYRIAQVFLSKLLVHFEPFFILLLAGQF